MVHYSLPHWWRWGSWRVCCIISATNSVKASTTVTPLIKWGARREEIIWNCVVHKSKRHARFARFMCGATSPPIGLPLLYPVHNMYIGQSCGCWSAGPGIATKKLDGEIQQTCRLIGGLRRKSRRKIHRSKIWTKIIRPQKLWKTVKPADYNIDRRLRDAVDKWWKDCERLHDGIDVGLVRDHKLTFVWW